MKILTYTNRWNLILDIIFKPRKVIEEIKLEKQESIDNLTKDYTERLQRIGYDQYKQGIAHTSITNNTLAIMKTAIVQEDGLVTASVEHKRLEPVRVKVPYFTDKISNEEQLEIAAKRISNYLIEEGFLQTLVIPHNNEVLVQLNAFGFKKQIK
jgi:hypothetical protein